MATLEDDAKKFWLGDVVKVHTIGRYSFIEYIQRGISNSQDNGKTRYAAYLDGKSIAHSYPTLEWAMIGVMVWSQRGANTDDSVSFIMRGIFGDYEAQ